jgi:hypothetical protein
MFGFLKNAHDHQDCVRALDLLVPITAVASVMPPYMRPFLFAGGAISSHVRRASTALRHIERASDACVAQRRRLRGSSDGRGVEDGRKDMLDGFLDIMHEKGEQKDFGLTEVKMEVYVALHVFRLDPNPGPD